MTEPQGQIALVTEQQRAAAVGIEATDGMEPPALAQLGWQQLQHRGPAPGVPAAAEHANGLVDQ